MDISNRLLLAEHTARTAGAALLHHDPLRVTSKGPHDYVTEMDVATEKAIRTALLGAYPEDGFFGEETGGDDETAGRWIVDPIDGTTNFIRGLPHYSISIAYAAGGELLLGCVYAPALNAMYLAKKGGGATLNGRPIRVSDTREEKDALLGMSFAHRNLEDNARMSRLLPQLSRDVGDMRRMGSAALDLCAVACGALDGFIELGLHLYDIAAGLVILREAGGRAQGWPGEEACEKTGNVFATNGLIDDWLAVCLGK